MVCLRKPYQFNFLKGCLPQILLGAFLNTFSHMWMTFNLKAIKKKIYTNSKKKHHG